MATIGLGPMQFDGTISGNGPMIWQLPEAASQTWVIGAVLTLDANGYVTIGGTDEDRILGIALQPGQNAASNGLVESPFMVANSDTIFRGNLYHASGASSTAWDHRYVGRSYGVVLVGSYFHIDLADLSNQRCLILGPSKEMSLSDLQIHARFQFNAKNRALAYTS